MLVYMNDGWSTKLQDVSVSASNSEFRVFRRGHMRWEMLLERGIFRCKSEDESDIVHMLFSPPRALRHGRSSYNMLEAACQFQDLLRAQGQQGWLISAYVMDGHLLPSCTKLFRARHALYYQVTPPDQLEPFAEDKDLVLGIRCRAHSIHNGLAWGLARHQSAEICDEAFLAISSLNNNSAGLFSRLDLWLRQVVRFAVRAGPSELVEAFWISLDISPSMLPLFVAADPWWNGECLLISASLEDDPEVFYKIRSIVAHSYRWLKWSTGRWCRAGRAGRYFVRSLCLGLDSAVAGLLADSDFSCPLLSGYNRSDSRVLGMKFCLQQINVVVYQKSGLAMFKEV